MPVLPLPPEGRPSPQPPFERTGGGWLNISQIFLITISSDEDTPIIGTRNGGSDSFVAPGSAVGGEQQTVRRLGSLAVGTSRAKEA